MRQELGYVVYGGQVGCLPDTAEWTWTINDAYCLVNSMRKDGIPEVKMRTMASVCRDNGLNPETASLDDAFGLLDNLDLEVLSWTEEKRI